MIKSERGITSGGLFARVQSTMLQFDRFVCKVLKNFICEGTEPFACIRCGTIGKCICEGSERFMTQHRTIVRDSCQKAVRVSVDYLLGV